MLAFVRVATCTDSDNGIDANVIADAIVSAAVAVAVAAAAHEQVDVIHCDLKPENILLQHAKRSNIKVIDFGSSCRSNNKVQ